MQEFSPSIFYHHPIHVLSFMSLLMALLSLWIRKTLWIWGSFGLISFMGAFASGLLTPIAFLPLAFFVLLIWGLHFDIHGLGRFLLAATTFLLGGALFFHLMPGFLDHAFLPYPLCLSFSKAFVGLALLGWVVPTLSLSKGITKPLGPPVGLALIGAAVLGSLFFLLNPSLWNFHLSFSFFPWAISTLFFVVIPEEALLRGFLQKELVQWMGGNTKSQICAIAITACIYPLFHLSWASDLSLLFPTFAAGLTYALLYQITKLVETSIACHFLVASIHYLFFGHLPFFGELPCLNFGL